MSGRNNNNNDIHADHLSASDGEPSDRDPNTVAHQPLLNNNTGGNSSSSSNTSSNPFTSLFSSFISTSNTNLFPTRFASSAKFARLLVQLLVIETLYAYYLDFQLAFLILRGLQIVRANCIIAI